MSDIGEETAKELYKVWSDVVTHQMELKGFKPVESGWENLPELQKRAWIITAQYVIASMNETIDMWVRGVMA